MSIVEVGFSGGIIVKKAWDGSWIVDAIEIS